MNSGALNKRITFNAMSKVSDALGDHLKPEAYKTVWANVKAVRGSEYYEAQKIRNSLTYKITCRYLDGITPEMTITYGTKTMKIETVIDINESHDYLEIQATEIIKK